MLPEKAIRTVEEHKMFGPGDLVVVGVSGGPDSVALLHWLVSYGRAHDVRLHVAHLNHMLRGEEGNADARWVAGLARQWNLPVTVEARDVNALRQERHLSTEDAARQLRYAFFAQVIKETGARCAAVGHTADDQVETIVLHWLRGAGLAGMRGMLPVMRYKVSDVSEAGVAPLAVIRPLLQVTRGEVEDYLRTYSLEARVDRSNLELVYLRNRIRQQLIPQLLDYNPRFKEATLRSAEIAADDFGFIQREVARVWNDVAREKDDSISFDRRAWSELHPSIERYVLREAVSRLVGDLVGLEAVHIADAMTAIREGRTGSVVTWPRGLRVVVGYDEFTVGYEQPAVEPRLSAEGQPLMVPGETDIVGTNWRVIARVAQSPCVQDANPWHADLDYAKSGSDLSVRRRRPGDRFSPLGMRAEKGLQDFMVDEKVPRSRRDDVPIVVGPRQIVWVAGKRIDDRVKLTPRTAEVLCLTFVERG